MKIPFPRFILLGLVLAPMALFGPSGCYILPDAAARDARKAAEFPRACLDGTKRDLQNYERADRRAGE